MNNLIDLVKKHEGLRLKPYRCTAGKLTIGYGRNIEDKGISKKEAKYLLENDLEQVKEELRLLLLFWDILSEVRRAVLMDMCFNLGLNGFMKFKKMLSALENKDYELAAKEMLNSKWATQVKGRANELAFMMIEDRYQDT